MNIIRRFNAQLDQIEARIAEAQARVLNTAAAQLTDEARAMIGTEPTAWPALAASTIAEKRRLGFTGFISKTDPLLRTGELRDSIGATVDPDGITLGSSSPIATFQENGTDTIPPRPFLAPTMERHAQEIAQEIGRVTAQAIRDAFGR
jgi:HK97 gp10 family phage protein